MIKELPQIDPFSAKKLSTLKQDSLIRRTRRAFSLAMLTKPGKKLDSSESSHHVSSSLGAKESANHSTNSNYRPLDIVHQSSQPRKEMQRPMFDPKKMENLIKPEPVGFSSNHHRPIPNPKIPSSPGSNMTESQQQFNTPNSNTKPNNIPSPKIPSSPGSNMTESQQQVNTSNSNTKPNSNSNSNMSSRSNSIESTSSNPSKPHTGGDIRWDAVNMLTSRGVQLGISDFRLLKRLGYGDIGSVYLVELRGTNTHFAMKVMDRASLASRNKLLRAQTEREILSLLDHPFLPTLYSHFETEKFYCLVMEFCGGGNLYSLRQKQPNKCFTEEASRFFASEVLLALEYLHMLGIVYRDLKPENVLVRDDGHIMLSDFDLSLRCSVSPTLVKSSSVHGGGGGGSSRPVGLIDEESAVQGCTQPSAFFPRILQSAKKNRKAKSDFGLFVNGSMPELMAEPTNVKSMSFVGTHEYLAPEIIRGEGHGSAVDWWTFGIFIYELLYGSTPFKGQGNRATLNNVIGQALRFPELPHVSSAARDLIKGLLVKEPQKRIAYKRGATEIKQHPFFEGVNWALIRSATPPHVPEPVDFSCFASKDKESLAAVDGGKKSNNGAGGCSSTGGGNGSSNSGCHDPDYIDFEYF